MKNAKDRLPRDLYINEPERKFNTCPHVEPAIRLRHLKRVFIEMMASIQTDLSRFSTSWRGSITPDTHLY
jgi:hypothetical protein